MLGAARLAAAQNAAVRPCWAGARCLQARPQLPKFLVYKTHHRRLARVRAEAYKAWPDRDFISETQAAFPAKGAATVEEARALFSSLGYVFLDVRSEVDVDEAGKVRGSVNIPMVYARKVWSPEQQQKVLVEEPNDEWVEQVEQRFPSLDTPLLVCCTDGTQLSIDAMLLLKEAGYRNVVGLRGGYSAWSQVFDNKLQRRKAPLGSAGVPGSPPPQSLPAGASSSSASSAAEEQLARLRAVEEELGKGLRALEDEVRTARAALERVQPNRILEQQAQQVAADIKAKDEQLLQYQRMVTALLTCTTKITSARAVMAAAEAEIVENEGDLALLNEEAAELLAKSRAARQGHQRQSYPPGSVSR